MTTFFVLGMSNLCLFGFSKSFTECGAYGREEKRREEKKRKEKGEAIKLEEN